jgi:hypothetical protein
MKCHHCAKDIPDGFTDCPWCGEPYTPDVLAKNSEASGALPAAPTLRAPSSAAGTSSAAPAPRATQPAIVWVVFALSFVVVVLAAIAVTIRKFGYFSWGASPTFIGACAAPYAVSAVILLAFYFISRQKVLASTKLLVAFSGATIFALVALFGSANPARPSPHPIATSDARPGAATTVHPHAPTVWDPALAAVYTDLKSRNDAYLAEISQLDLTARPLYVADSFRDNKEIRQILAQLDDRNAVGQKYSSWDSVIAKAPEYVSVANASEQDKRKFLAAFTPAIQRIVDERNSVSHIEREWLLSTVDLYRFMLSHQGTYTISADGRQGNFLQPGLADQFNAKLRRAATLKQQFVQASRAFQTKLGGVREQLGAVP